MPFKDLRDFIAKLEEVGEAQRIEDEVDWDLEAGAMLRRSCEEGLPAPFFTKVKEYPQGYSLFGSTLASYKRIAIAMDMHPDTHPREIIAEYMSRKQRAIKPVLVNDGPCKENIIIGDEVDLLKFPVPLVHDGDGGRYIGTWHLVISRDLNSDWVNWGIYRLMMHSKDTLGIRANPQSHVGMMYLQSYESRNKPMDIAIAIGVEPISTLCAASPMPYNTSEVDIAGGIRGEPLELIKCETVDLAVPATAEIVIEGEIRPYEREEEGPFGEFTGYMFPRKRPSPVIHVKAITHRNNPILTMSCVGIPIGDDHAIFGITVSAEILEVLRAAGLPVTAVSVLPETSGLLVIVAVKAPYPNVADVIADLVWGSRGGMGPAYLIVVDDDVDPFNMAEVVHALVTKCHPYRGINRREHAFLMPTTVWASPYERQHRLGAKAYFDCTWPLDWDPGDVPRRISFKEAYPPEVQQRAMALWRTYGY